jgi:hypothetical protein
MKLVYKGKRRTDGKITLFRPFRHVMDDGRECYKLPFKYTESIRLVGVICIDFGMYYKKMYFDPETDRVTYFSFCERKETDQIPVRLFEFVFNPRLANAWYDKVKLAHAIPVENVKETTKKEWL